MLGADGVTGPLRGENDGGRRAMDESFWRHRCEEARGIAETLKTPPAKCDMSVLAAAYARLARFARRRVFSNTDSSVSSKTDRVAKPK